jgi:hypothetical protein
MSELKGPSRPIDGVIHYYSVSAAFTKAEEIHLRLIQFHYNPRSIESENLISTTGTYYGRATAAGWLVQAAGLAAERMIPPRMDKTLYEQMQLPLE